MVFTRNQKRKHDDSQDILIENVTDNLEVKDESTNIKIKKKRKTKQEYSHKEIEQTQNKQEDQDTDDSFVIKTEEQEEVQTEEQEEDQTEDQTEEQEEDPTEDQKEDTTTLSENDDQDFEETSRIGQLGDIISKTIQSILVNNIKKDDDSDEYSSIRDEYDKYLAYLESIYTGKFFERVSIDEKKRTLKENYSQQDIERLNSELEQIKQAYRTSAPSVLDILKMDIGMEQKQKLLERVHQFSNSEILSNDYSNNLKILNNSINQSKDTELLELERQILQRSNDLQYSDNYRERILRSKMSLENKVIAYKRLEVMQSFESTDTSEYSKYKAWMDILLSIPYDTTVGNKINEDTSDVFRRVRGVLDRRLSFLERAKDQVINIVTQMARNPDFSINAIGLYGPKGTGKTSLVKSISEALGRPYRTISLGGESDSSLLTGHGFTYVGSCPGRIIEILRETKCTNPIILFDELDKVSETHHGKEIIGNLIHMTDSSTNTKYNYDKYFAGLEFDLSKVLFIFTYNDQTKVDPILADRLFKIRVDNYSTKEKLEITETHLIKSVLDQYHLDTNQITFDKETVDYIVQNSISDQGMRDIKRKFETIVSRVNTLMLTNPEDNIIKLKYKSLYPYYKTETRPLVILKEHVDIFLSDSSSSDVKSNEPPFGMYI